MTDRKKMIAVVALLGTCGFSGHALATNSGVVGLLDPNWGELTAGQILTCETWNQGAHAADPGEDGVGNGLDDDDLPRVGLANLVEIGNLTATTELVTAGLTCEP